MGEMDRDLGNLDVVRIIFHQSVCLTKSTFKKPVPFWQILTWQMVSGYVWFALSPLILWLTQKFPFEAGKWRKSLIVHLFAGVIIAFFQQAVDTFFLTKLGYPPNRQFQSFLEAYQYFIFINLCQTNRSERGGKSGDQTAEKEARQKAEECPKEATRTAHRKSEQGQE